MSSDAAAGSSEPKHYPVLDGIRGLAILLVMLSHFLKAGHEVTTATWWGRLSLGGFVGVDLFFVLSGFLITGILLKSRMDTPRAFGVFYARRALRIFPLYYTVLALVFLLCPAGQDSPWWYFLFLSNIGSTVKGTWLDHPAGVDLGHFWSLAVEEQFYMVWPFLVAFLPRRHLEKVCLACLVIAPAVHYALHYSGNPIGSYMFTPTRLNTLAGGAWLAIVFQDQDQARWAALSRWAGRVCLAAGAITVAGLIFPQQVSLVPFSPFLWGSLVVLALGSRGVLEGALSSRPLLTLGRLSYGLYILHSLFDPWLKGTLHDRWIMGALGGQPLVALGVFTLAAFALSLLAAQASWLLLERPCLSLKRHFRYASTDSKTPPPSNLPPS
ncbi:acyltransferase [Luteolibacter flavescens]|uniref:Acyltransferase n=1 Tax=Luteolibacter flavescens TaxID=1859460 RepID=A0ABT3FSX2_9BACT|nr:acyltransferase [Luteolibacter flavescens]MCW1886650.1 acyltransferase [Luteolibacter flavescens]